MKTTAWILSLGLAVSSFAADTTYKGYLADAPCDSSGHSMDGSDLAGSPGEHSVACQIACAKGGYGVMRMEGKAYTFVPFDDRGNELATAILSQTKKTKGVVVEVMGSLKMGVIRVSSLKEASM